MTDAGLALLLWTVRGTEDKGCGGGGGSEAVCPSVFVDGPAWSWASLVCLCWSWLVLTSVLSVKAVAVGSSQCRYHHTTELHKDRSAGRARQDSPVSPLRQTRWDQWWEWGLCIDISLLALLPWLGVLPHVSPVQSSGVVWSGGEVLLIPGGAGYRAVSAVITYKHWQPTVRLVRPLELSLSLSHPYQHQHQGILTLTTMGSPISNIIVSSGWLNATTYNIWGASTQYPVPSTPAPPCPGLLYRDREEDCIRDS